MTVAAPAAWLPVLRSIDQSLDEVRAVKLRSVVRDVGGLLTLLRALVPVGRLAVELGRHWPPKFSSTEEVWVVAEAIEPHIFEAFARIGGSGSMTDVRGNESVAGLDADLSCRLAYVQTLMRQLAEDNPRLGPRSGPRPDARARRAELQRVLDNGDVAPEVRLVLHQSRLLPVLTVLGATARLSSRSHVVIRQALREGLDSLIGFLLALVPDSPAAAPALIRDQLPDPLPLVQLDERWRRVRATWIGTPG